MSQHPVDRPDLSRPRAFHAAGHPDTLRYRAIPRYKLILHQDVKLELMFIVRTVMELTRLCRAEATNKMWQAYHLGRADLLVTYRERAEMFAELFLGRGLTVTIEPA